MNHEINLTGYTASCNAADNMLCLGTAGSYGLEKLHVTADAAWDGLTITATFTNSGSTTVAVTDGAVDVPPEATRMPTRDRVRYGQIAFKGADADGSIRLISTPIYYKVQASSATDGENTIAPTPDQYAQFVAEVTAEADRAEAAANRAESAGSNVTPEQIAEAVNSYLDENPVQPTAIDATLTQSGQAADAKAVGDAISNIELTPGPAGADGTNGKSAYQYAQEGGYTGTEEEFAAKLAEEMPEKLPNPHTLTVTGAVTGSYDGSAPLTVEIPRGGGGRSEWELLAEYTMLVSDRALVIDLSQFEGITHFRILGEFPKCTEECGDIWLYLGTFFKQQRSPNHKQNVYAFNLLAECELVDGQLYGFIGTIDGWNDQPRASVVRNTPRDSTKITSFKIYYNNLVKDSTENTIQIWGY